MTSTAQAYLAKPTMQHETRMFLRALDTKLAIEQDRGWKARIIDRELEAIQKKLEVYNEIVPQLEYLLQELREENWREIKAAAEKTYADQIARLNRSTDAEIAAALNAKG